MSSKQPSLTDSGLDVSILISTVWRSRWFIVLVTTFFGCVAAVYSLLATEWYRTDVVLVPVERRATPAGLGQISGLANLAGISLGQASNQEAIAVLRSRDYAREFIAKYELAPLLLTHSTTSADQSNIGPALRVFEKLVRSVEFDRKTGLVTLTMRWTDADTVAKWANDYVSGVNDRMRLRALKESEQNVAFLNREMASSTVVSMQQSLGRVLETEMQKLMLAKGNLEFAFKVVDPGYPPDRRYSPQRTLTVLISMIFGGFVAVVLALLRETVFPSRKVEREHD
jgi:uncharacterized protein involved in exopolysaccharide biosynthesis